MATTPSPATAATTASSQVARLTIGPVPPDSVWTGMSSMPLQTWTAPDRAPQYSRNRESIDSDSRGSASAT